jgi:hypothetical protein
MYVTLYFPHDRSNMSAQIFILRQIYGIYWGKTNIGSSKLSFPIYVYIFKLFCVLVRNATCSCPSLRASYDKIFRLYQLYTLQICLGPVVKAVITGYCRWFYTKSNFVSHVAIFARGIIIL